MLQVKYFGGHVIPNAKIYAVFWTTGVAAETQAGIGGFYEAITNSEWMDWLTEYSTPAVGGTGQVIGRGVFAAARAISPVTPTRTCVVTSNGTIPSGPCVWEADIAAELRAQIDAGHLSAPNLSTLYMVHFPAGVVIQTQDRSAGIRSDSCVDYCSYHDTAARAGAANVYFAVLPDHGRGSGCDLGCGAGTVFANLCSSASHELGEAITDAEVGLVTGAASAPLGWYDDSPLSQGEIGDMCNQATDTVTSLVTGTSYTAQNLFSRTVWEAAPDPGTLACVSTRHAPDDFAVFFAPAALAVKAGEVGSIPVHLVTTSGVASNVGLTVSPASILPPGVHATLSTSLAVSGGSGSAPVAALQVSVDPGTPGASDRLVVVEASAGALVHSAAVLLQATPQAPAGRSSGGGCSSLGADLGTAGALALLLAFRRRPGRRRSNRE